MSYLNYLIEANFSLVIFYCMYWLLLRNETQFSVQRFVLLGGVIISFVFPLIHINNIQPNSQAIIPSLSHTLPAYWLPEMVIRENGEEITIITRTAFLWNVVRWIYLIISAIILLAIAYQLRKFIQWHANAKSYHWNGVRVYEVDGKNTAFSFWKSIYLGPGEWTEEEKEKILRHEEVHLRQLHTLDVLLLQFARVIFWFNPVVYFYQGMLTHVHEYEADTKSVDRAREDHFCLLLVKSTLKTSGISLAHHFSNSITLKRIAMIKTKKNKIKSWRLAGASVFTMIIFLTIGCQDQVMQEISSSTITQVGSYPAEVQRELDKLKAQFPNETFSYVEGSKEDISKMIDEAGKLDFVRSVHSFNRASSIVNGVILSNVAKHAVELQTTNEVFTVVEQSATPKGGMIALYEFLATNLSYPTEARRSAIQGKVFVEFIVNTDGSLSDLKALKTIGGGCDEEALRVMAISPTWNPGMQQGKKVRQRMVLPINFKLDDVSEPK